MQNTRRKARSWAEMGGSVKCKAKTLELRSRGSVSRPTVVTCVFQSGIPSIYTPDVPKGRRASSSHCGSSARPCKHRSQACHRLEARPPARRGWCDHLCQQLPQSNRLSLRVHATHYEN